MKHYLKTSTAAVLALALLSAPLGLAQPAPNHNDTHGGPPKMDHPAPVAHTQMAPQHVVAPVHVTNEHVTHVTNEHVTHVTNEHVTHVTNETVNENVHTTVVAHPGGWQPGHTYVYHGHPMPQAQFSGHYWHHGDRYDGPRYVVNNWQYYDLQAPPAGYEWEQDGDQFVLVAVTTGIIADIILGALNQ